MKEIIFAGFGGQGVLTGGLIVAYIASKQGKDAVWMPAYGPTMRGGKANCTVKFCENAGERIGSPVMEEADILIAMNEPSLDYLELCKSNAQVFVNSDSVPADHVYPEGISVTAVDVVSLAAEAGNVKGQNLVMLGAVVKKTGIFTVEEAEKGMCAFFEEKGKGKFNESNLAAIRKGFEAV